MTRWLLAIGCVVGFTISGLTLYSTSHTFRQFRVARTASTRVLSADQAPGGKTTVNAAQVTVAGLPSTTAATPAAVVRPDALPPLNVRLLGTFVGESPANSVALMEDHMTGERRACRVGEMVQGRQLVEIARAYVLLAAGESRERVELELGSTAASSAEQPSDGLSSANQMTVWEPITELLFRPKRALSPDETRAVKAAIKPVSDTERVVERQTVLEVLNGDPFQVIREAGLRPAFQSGRLVGVELGSVPDDSILHQSGFQVGDVVRSVNGQPVTDPTVALKLPTHLQQAGVVEVQVERNGQPVTLKYRMQ